ncbi:MAG: cyanophycinase [Bacteroidota bacterium]
MLATKVSAYMPAGKLISIGGNEDKYTEREPEFTPQNTGKFFELGILERVVRQSGGHDAHIEVIPTASSIPDEVGDNYLQAFSKIGCTNVHVMPIRDRSDVGKKKYLKRIREAQAVMFSGGNQYRLTTTFGGTEMLDIMHERYQQEPFVIAGTSAGAMAMSNTMIYQGSSSEALFKGAVKITTGLGFIKDVIIDSHFVKRGRFGRLTQAVASNPSAIGIGLGEDTGVLVTEGNRLQTIGTGLVLIFDGRKIRHNNVSDLPDGAPISIENMKVHVMAKGDTYLLSEHKFLAASELVST